MSPLDAVALRADLHVETRLAGDAAVGAVLPIAWEELARDRPRRFDPGTRILVVLEPLPGWSIWRSRLAGREASGIARRGEAFLRDPDPRSVAILTRLLAAPAAERGDAELLSGLVSLVADGAPSLASDALTKVAETPGLAARLGEAEVAVLRKALADPARPPGLREALVAAIGERGLAVFEPDLVAASAAGSPLASEAIAARVALGWAPSPEEVEALLTRDEPEVRAAALRHAPDALPETVLRARLASDPAPAVRAEAARGLVRKQGIAALASLAPRLGAPDTLEGAATARAFGELGEPAVAPLVDFVRTRGIDETRGALLALSLAGPHGLRALRALAEGHPDALVRGFAGFLLGRAPEAH